MLTKRQERNLMLWDVITLFLSLLGIIVFTAIFVVVENEMRVALVLEMAFAVYSFSKSAKGVEDYYKKYKLEKIETKSLGLKIA